MPTRTPPEILARAKQKRAAIKALGGEAYQALLARGRDARARFRKEHPELIRAQNRQREKTRVRPLKAELTRRARQRARKSGIEATVMAADLHWPTHCPVLGIALDYTPKKQGRTSNNPANPSLDRWDNTKGYVPGNVFVISFRANTLKNNATCDELDAIAKYARCGVVR